MQGWKAAAFFVAIGTIGVGACGGDDPPSTPPPAGDGGASTSSGGSSGTSGASGTTSGAVPPPITELTEKEPNNGPDYTGMQDLGSFTGAKTIKITGRLETGGFDGASYTGDFDAFKLKIEPTGGTLTVDVDWTGTGDVDAAFYDKQLTLVAGKAAAEKPINSTGPAPPGEYAIVLYSKDMPADWTMTMKYTVPVAGTGGSCVSTLAEAPGGGCSFTMNEPANNGESITLPYRFGWRSDGCETPGKVYFYGNPPTEDNWISFQYVRGSQTSLLNVTGTHDLTAAEVGELRSDNGTYHWQLESFHKARSPGRTFTIAPGVCK